MPLKLPTTIQGYPFNIDSSTLKPDDDKIQFDLIINYYTNTGNVDITVGTSISVDTDQVATKMIKFFKSEGFTNAQTAGIMGNAFAESGLNPTVEIIDTNGKPSGGLFQWNAERLQALKNYSSKNGKNYKTVEAQLAYLVTEPDYRRAKQAILSSDNVSNAAFSWASLFERCDICQNRSLVASSKRTTSAVTFLQRINSGYYDKKPETPLVVKLPTEKSQLKSSGSQLGTSKSIKQ